MRTIFIDFSNYLINMRMTLNFLLIWKLFRSQTAWRLPPFSNMAARANILNFLNFLIWRLFNYGPQRGNFKLFHFE